MSYTDFLRLSEHKIFKNARESLPEKISKSLNILTVKENVLFLWDFKDSCVISLNVAAARGIDGDDVIVQNLLPLNPPLFSPELLRVNDTVTLVAVAGPSGVLILELPTRYPPHGAFDHNKEVVVCRSHSLDERLLLCSDNITVKQVRFHPGSVNNNHVVVLTSENLIRFYKIENNEAVNLGVYQLGVKPIAKFPGSKTTFLAALGDTAVDFDFGHPEIEEDCVEVEDNAGVSLTNKDGFETTFYNVRTQTEGKKIIPKYMADTYAKENIDKDWTNVVWPIYILRGDGRIYCFSVSLTKKSHPKLRGPLPERSTSMSTYPEACSIICLRTNPEIICCAMKNGLVYHQLVLPIDYEEGMPQRVVDEDEGSISLIDVANKEVYVFEILELELGLGSDTMRKNEYELYMFADESKCSRYYVTLNIGIHSVDMPTVEELQNYANENEDDRPTEDLFSQSSKAEYLICTKTLSNEKTNPIVGFSPYYSPASVIAMLADGSVITMAASSAPMLRSLEDVPDNEPQLKMESPLKKMMNEPFDLYIQKLLTFPNQPILKLSTNTNSTPKDCYELLQRATQIFREKYFPNIIKVQEEIEKRLKSLKMLKEYQLRELEKIKSEKQVLQEKAEGLAEKYEDTKDKQDELMKRCERLLILVSQKKSEPSDAEKQFLKELKEAKSKVEEYEVSTEKLKLKVNYQRVKMENWKSQELKKHSYLTDMQENTIRTNLEEMTRKIQALHKQVVEYKKLLNIK